LLQEHYINKDNILVLDNPEGYLHPIWQLELAKLITYLVKNNVNMQVNSCQKYSVHCDSERAADHLQIWA
jgi:predicted ATPase